MSDGQDGNSGIARISVVIPDAGIGNEPSNDIGATSPAAIFTGADDNHGDDFDFDPERHIGRDKRNADGSYRRKRRPRGGGGAERKPREKRSNVSRLEAQQATARMFLIISGGIANFTKTPEYKFDEDDANTCGAAWNNWAEEFGVKPDPKIEATIGLVTALSFAIGPRIAMANARRADEKKAKKSATDPNVVDFTQIRPTV